MAQQMLTFKSNNAVSVAKSPTPLKLVQIEDILKKFEESVGFDCVPFRPKENEIYIVKPSSNIKKEDWRADGHCWINNGVRKIPKNDPIVIKSYFILRLPDGSPCKGFRKEC